MGSVSTGKLWRNLGFPGAPPPSSDSKVDGGTDMRKDSWGSFMSGASSSLTPTSESSRRVPVPHRRRISSPRPHDRQMRERVDPPGTGTCTDSPPQTPLQFARGDSSSGGPRSARGVPAPPSPLGGSTGSYRGFEGLRDEEVYWSSTPTHAKQQVNRLQKLMKEGGGSVWGTRRAHRTPTGTNATHSVGPARVVTVSAKSVGKTSGEGLEGQTRHDYGTGLGDDFLL